MSRRIAVVTGTRAEYGLLRGVMENIDEDPQLELQAIATGMHLAPEFGLTFREIEADGFTIDDRIEILLGSDSAVGIGKSIGLATIGFADSFARLQPDMIVVLGDRFEILAVASAALVAKIPLAHIHGGEITEGAFDESIRHAVTKMAHLHFVAAEEYRNRVIQLGEDPARVFNVGALGVEAVRERALMGRAALEESLGVSFSPRNLVITFHSATLDRQPPEEQLAALFEALDKLPDEIGLFFTLPNADSGGRRLGELTRDYADTRANAQAFPSLGQLRYLSLMAQADGVVGNSSSGLIEGPAMGIGTVNIGDRQKGRLRASSIIDCAAETPAIQAAIAELLSDEFRAGLAQIDNPYGTGRTSQLIVEQIKTIDLTQLGGKKFHDLANPPAPAITRKTGVRLS